MRYLNRVFFNLLLILFSTTMGIHPLKGAEQPGKPLASKPAIEPIALFNGNDLSGWEQVGEARWEVKDGLLIGRQGPDGEPGDLLTDASYDDFELAVFFRVKWPANTGVWFRYQSETKAYQADILEYENPIAYSGTLYCPGKMFLAINNDAKLVRRDGWNELVIRAEGDRLVIHINGNNVADVRDDTSAHGRIGLQVHAGDEFTGMQIVVKEFKLRQL